MRMNMYFSAKQQNLVHFKADGKAVLLHTKRQTTCFPMRMRSVLALRMKRNF